MLLYQMEREDRRRENEKSEGKQKWRNGNGVNTMAARQAERSVDEREWMCRRIRKRVERQRAQYVCARRTPARGDEAVKNETDNEDGNNDNLQFSNSMQRNAMQCNGQGRMQDGRNGAEMVGMGPQCWK